MERFTIQCTTCRARLKVNDESVIGDILACPKCGSMVHVVPPVGWTRSGEVSAPPADVSQPQAAAAVIPPAIPPAIRPAIPPRPAPSPTAPVVSTVAATTAVAASGANLPTMPPAAPSSSGRLAAAWSAVTALAKQDWRVLAGGLAGGIVLGGGVWLILALQAPEAPVVAEIESPATVAAQPKASVEAISQEDTTSPNRPAPTEAVHPTIEPPPHDDVATEPPQSSPAAPADQPAASQPPAEEPGALAPGMADRPAPGPTIKLEPAPAAVVDSGPVEPEPPNKSAADDAPRGDEAPGDFGPGQLAPNPGESPGVPHKILTAEEIDERLAKAIGAVEFNQVPLANFVEFVSDLTGVSVSIDEAALARIGKRRKSQVSIKLAGTTAGDALRAATGKLGLTCVVRDGRVVITSAQESRAAK